MTPEQARHFAELALRAVHREYPNKLAHVLHSDADVRAPRELTPLFYGCFDWHSSVHSHWSLVRILRSAPGAELERRIEGALERSFVSENVAGELAYLRGPGREGFEAPYGMAWLLTLARELWEWDDPRARRWAEVLAPLEALGAERLVRWARRLPFPVRTGEHTQSAFGLALLIDWARARGDDDCASFAIGRARELHATDRDAPLHLEPSGYDFFSPCLSVADLMRRALGTEELSRWLARFLPNISESFLSPVSCPDPADAKLSHLDGLNLSRAWMLEGIASALGPSDPRRGVLERAAEAHRSAGVAAVTGEHYEGSHWQGSFAVYLLTRRWV